MFNEQTIKDLAEVYSKKDDIVTLCLNTDLSEVTEEKMRIELKGLLSQIEKAGLSKDADKIREKLAHLRPNSYKALYVISSVSKGIFHIFELHVSFSSFVSLSSIINLVPLLRLLDVYRRHALVHVTKEKASFFSIHFGKVDYSESFQKEIQGRHKQGGWSQARFQRHAENEAEQNFKVAADLIFEEYKKAPFDALILAGAEENTNKIRKMLHQDLHERVVVDDVSDAHLEERDVEKQALRIVEKIDQDEKQALIQTFENSLGEGNKAVRGIDNIIDVIHEGRGMNLIVLEGYEVSGNLCRENGHVSVASIDQMDCDGEKSIVSDIMPFVLRNAVIKGAHVSFVKESDVLKNNKHIGALVRY
jgi:peptide chain release factor subunit 1